MGFHAEVTRVCLIQVKASLPSGLRPSSPQIETFFPALCLLRQKFALTIVLPKGEMADKGGPHFR